MKLLEEMSSASEEDFDRLFRQIPYVDFLGVRCRREGDRRLYLLEFNDHLVGNTRLPALHGGAIGAFLETAAIAQVLFETGATSFSRTVGLTVQYLRSGRGEDMWARAVLTKHGQRVVNVRVEAWQEDETRPIATAQGHFLV